MPVSAEAAHLLVDAHRMYLRGVTDQVDLKPLGALANLLCDSEGWREAATVDTHEALGEALRAFEGAVHSGDEQLKLYRSHGHERTVATLTTALRLRWGLSRFPDTGALTIPGETHPVADETLKAWESRVLSSPAARAALLAVAERSTSRAPAIRTGPRPFPNFDAEALPDASYGPSIEQIAAEHQIDRQQAGQLLRHAATRAIAWYFGASPELLVHHVESTRSAWFRDDPRYVDDFVRGSLRAETLPRRRNLSIFEVRERIVVDLHLRLAMRTPAALASVLADRAAGSLFLKVSRRVPSTLELSRLGSPTTVGDLAIDPDSAIGRLWRAAADVRANYGAARSYRVEDYLKIREEMAAFLPAFREEILSVVILADQSVGTDIISLGDPRLMARLNVLRGFGDDHALRAYQRALPLRDSAQVLAKGGQLAAAVDLTNAAIQTLDMLVDEGGVDSKSILESYQQAYLSNAGTAARMLEGIIRSLPTKKALRRLPRVYDLWRDAARNYADQCMALLTELDEGELGLTEQRHSDLHISSEAWRIQPRLIALRVRVLSVILARLIGNVAPHDLRRWQDEMISSYLDLTTHPQTLASHAPQLVQNAVLVAMVNDLTLPVARPYSPALGAASFLTLDPSEVEDTRVRTGARVTVDTEWMLRARRFIETAPGTWDRGPLSRMPASSFAAKSLARMSGGLWLQWLD